MTTSPYGERPFAGGLWTYSFQWRGEYDWFEPIWSYSALQFDKAKGAFQNLVSLGNKFNFSDEFSFVFDWTGSFVNAEWREDGYAFNQFRGVLKYTPSDSFDASLHAVFSKGYGEDLWSGIGALVQFYPLKDCQDLRIHADIAYYPSIKQPSLTVGALYNIRIRCW